MFAATFLSRGHGWYKSPHGGGSSVKRAHAELTESPPSTYKTKTLRQVKG